MQERMTAALPRLLTTKEVAAITGFTVSFLKDNRRKKSIYRLKPEEKDHRFLRFHKVNGTDMIRYIESEVIEDVNNMITTE